MIVMHVKRHIRDEGGATAAEYAILAAAIAAIIVATVSALGASVSGLFQFVLDEFLNI